MLLYYYHYESLSREIQLSVHLPGRCMSIMKNSLKDWGQVCDDVRPRDASSRSELNVLSIHRHVRFGMNDTSSWGVHFSEEKRFNRISPTQKTTASLTTRESFFPFANIPSYDYFLWRRKVFSGRAMNRNRSLVFHYRDIVKKKRWSARNKLSKTLEKWDRARESYGTRRETIWNNLRSVNAYRGTWMRNGSKFITVVRSNRIHII